MAYKILFSEDAILDLESILDFIYADNPEAADRFGTGLLNHVHLLQNFPRLGVPIPETFWRPEDPSLPSPRLLQAS